MSPYASGCPWSGAGRVFADPAGPAFPTLPTPGVAGKVSRPARNADDSAMCGRLTLYDRPDAIAAVFGLDAAPDLPPRYNVAPSQPMAAVRADGGGRVLVQLL